MKQNLLILITTILEIGTEQTQFIVNQAINLPYLRELTKNQNPRIRKSAFILISMTFLQKQILNFKQQVGHIRGKSNKQRIEIAQNGLMKQICDVFKEGRKSIENYGGLIIYAYQILYELVVENEELIKQEFNEGGCLDELFQLYLLYSPQQIFNDLTLILNVFLKSMPESLKLKMKNEKYILPLIHLMDSNYEDVLIDITSFLSIILSKINEAGNIQQQDEFRLIMENNGGMTKLICLFHNNSFQENQIKNYCACSIGLLYKAMKIPDQFRSQVIEQLKLLSEDQSNINILLSSIALARLSECKENHTDIVSGNFPNIFRKLISSDYLRIIDQGMMLALNLLHLGTDETRIIVKEGVPSYVVVGLLQNRDKRIALTAQLLDQWLLAIS